MQQQGRAKSGYAISVLAAVVWALTSPGIKFLLETYRVPELLVAFWRDAFMAVTCVTALALFRPELLRVARRDLWGFAVIGALSIGVYHALWVTSIALNGAAVAVVMIYTFPVFVTLGARVFFKEIIRWPQIMALILALAGSALLVRLYDPAVLRVSWLGVVVGLSTGLAHAGYVLFSQRAVREYSPWTSLTYTMLFGAAMLLALSLIGGINHPAGPVASLVAIDGGAVPWLVLLLLALGPTLGGYALFTLALRFVPGRIASLIVVLEVPLAALLAVALLGERLEWPQVIGMALVLAAAVLPGLVRETEPAAPRLLDDAPLAAEV